MRTCFKNTPLYRYLKYSVACILCMVNVAIASPELKNIQIAQGTQQTVVMLDFSELSALSMRTLPKSNNMYRLVIDTPYFKTKIQPTLSVKGSDFISLVRYGTYTPQISRIVIESKKPLRIDTLKIDKSARMSRLKVYISPSAKFVPTKKQTNNWDNVEKENTIAEQKRKIAQEKSYAKIKSQKGRIKPLIVIDAGHGGHDPGAIGRGNLYEKHVTLAIAKHAKITLENTGKFKVILTRSDDRYIPLRERYSIAEKVRADFFLSIHADKHHKSSTRGMSVYTLSDASREREARRLKTNKTANTQVKNYFGHTGSTDISGIIGDLGLKASTQASDIFATILVSHMKKNNIVTLRNPSREAGLAVLKSPTMPSALIETAYMSNKYDVINLQSNRWRKRFATALANAVQEYFAKHPLKQ